MWTTPSTADPFCPKALRGSAGSIFRVPIRLNVEISDAIKMLHSHQIKVFGTTQDGERSYDEIAWRDSVALIMGSEGSGLDGNEIQFLDGTIRIPMMGHVESLNVGSAAAICLFEASKQRRGRQ